MRNKLEEKNNIPQIRFKNFDENWEVKEFKEIFSNLPNNTLSRAELNYQTGLFKNVHYGDVLIKFGELPFSYSSRYANLSPFACPLKPAHTADTLP